MTVGWILPSFFPTSVPAPLAYYFFNEGEGWDLMNSVNRKNNSGTIIYVEDHQLHANGTEGADHLGPNWQAASRLAHGTVRLLV